MTNTVSAVIARLQAQVPALKSVERVGELAALIGQTITEKFAVILFIRQPGDAKGDKAGLLIEELKPAIKTALIGWRPQAEAKTPVWYQSGRLVSIEAGAVYYQMEFLVQQRYRVFA